ASGFAGVYTGPHAGLAMRLAISVNFDVSILKIAANGELQFNTSDLPRTANGVTIGAKSFRLLLAGSVNILEVIKFDASFMIQVGGGDVTVGRGPTQRTFTLGPSDWVIDFTARADFFSLATLSIAGWISSTGS